MTPPITLDITDTFVQRKRLCANLPNTIHHRLLMIDTGSAE